MPKRNAFRVIALILCSLVSMALLTEAEDSGKSRETSFKSLAVSPVQVTWLAPAPD